MITSPRIRQLLDLVAHPEKTGNDPYAKEQSEAEVCLLEDTFKNTRLSQLLFERSRSVARDIYNRFTKEDVKALVEQINVLKGVIAEKDKQIEKLASNREQRALYKEIQFLTSNNHNLYKSACDLQKQIKILSKELAQRSEKQKRLLQKVSVLNQQMCHSKRIVKKLLKSHKRIIECEEEEIERICSIKFQFEKENEALRSQIKSIQRVHLTEVTNRTGRSKYSTKELQTLSTLCTESRQIDNVRKGIIKNKNRGKDTEGRQKENRHHPHQK